MHIIKKDIESYRDKLRGKAKQTQRAMEGCRQSGDNLNYEYHSGKFFVLLQVIDELKTEFL